MVVEAEADVLQYPVMTEARPEGVARSGAGGGGPDLVVVAEAPADPGAGLLARHRAGERGAFEALVGHYRGSIYGFFRRNQKKLLYSAGLFTLLTFSITGPMTQLVRMM